MARSQESFQKKEVRKKKEKKRKEKEKRRQERKESDKPNSLDDMIAYVDAEGNITDTPPDPEEKSSLKAKDIEVSVPKQDPSEKEANIRKGTLTYFNESKGYGFINDADSNESIFVHINEFQDEISKGDLVTFEIGKGQKGAAAMRVKRVS